MIKRKLLCVLVLCLTLLSVTAVYAFEGGDEILTVSAAWVDGEMLRINGIDVHGQEFTLALRLSDYVSDTGNERYITVQAADLQGNKSGVIQLKNPYYVPPEEPEPAAVTPSNVPPAVAIGVSRQTTESAIPVAQPADTSTAVNGINPFTPEGTGAVVDNAGGGDGKEFFTIDTEDGNVFYLIVDRARNTDNVYLLNAVTENDLASLAKVGDGKVSAVPETQTASPLPDSSETTPEPPPEPQKADSSNTSAIFIVIAVVAAGGAGYYFKIVRPKKNGEAGGYDETDEFDDDTEADMEDDLEENGEDGEDE